MAPFPITVIRPARAECFSPRAFSFTGTGPRCFVAAPATSHDFSWQWLLADRIAGDNCAADSGRRGRYLSDADRVASPATGGIPARRSPGSSAVHVLANHPPGDREGAFRRTRFPSVLSQPRARSVFLVFFAPHSPQARQRRQARACCGTAFHSRDKSVSKPFRNAALLLWAPVYAAFRAITRRHTLGAVRRSPRRGGRLQPHEFPRELRRFRAIRRELRQLRLCEFAICPVCRVETNDAGDAPSPFITLVDVAPGQGSASSLLRGPHATQ